jgi:hypothetical protein
MLRALPGSLTPHLIAALALSLFVAASTIGASAQDPAGVLRDILQDVGQASDLLRKLGGDVGVALMPASGGMLAGCCPQTWDGSRNEVRNARTGIADAIRNYGPRLDRASLTTLGALRTRADRVITNLDGIASARDRTLIQRTVEASLTELGTLARDLASLEAKFGAMLLVYTARTLQLWTGEDPLNPFTLAPGETRKFNLTVADASGSFVALKDVIVDLWASGSDAWLFTFPASVTLRQGQVMDTALAITAATSVAQNASVVIKARVRSGTSPQYSGEEAWMTTGILVPATSTGSTCSTSSASPTLSASTSSIAAGATLTITLGPGCDPGGTSVLVYIETDNTSLLDPPLMHAFSSNTSKTITVTAGTPTAAGTVRLRALRGTAASAWVPITVLVSS